VCEGLTPQFLSTDLVERIHLELVAWAQPQHCNVERLDSAVHAVESYAAYGEPDDLFDLAAAYAFYISEAQAFLEGSKRTALVACMDFLKINGVPTQYYDDPDLFDWMLDLANKRISREEFAERLRRPFEEP
jgi:death-on-curing protein